MIKLMIVGRRAPGRSRKGAHGHLRETHARMVVCPPAGAGAMPLDYCQNHVVDGAYPGIGAHAIERDFVTELWFESGEHLKTATTTPYYLATLRPDEPRFVDDATVVAMMVRPTTLAEGDAAAPFKVFLLLSGDGASAAERFHSLPGIGRAVANEVLPPPGGGERFVDLILEGWCSSLDAAIEIVEGFGGRPGDHGFARERSLALAAEQYDTTRLREFHR